MYQLVILLSVIAAISLLTSFGFSYAHRNKTVKQLSSTLQKIEREFFDELSNIDLSELSQTPSGRELLVMFVYPDKREPYRSLNIKEAHHPQDIWSDPNYRRRMIELARENERREREMRNLPRITIEEYRKRPLAG